MRFLFLLLLLLLEPSRVMRAEVIKIKEGEEKKAFLLLGTRTEGERGSKKERKKKAIKLAQVRLSY